MGFLTKIFASIIPIALNWAYNKISDWIEARKKAAADKKEIADKNRAAREASEKASTPKEREDAAKKIIDSY